MNITTKAIDIAIQRHGIEKVSKLMNISVSSIRKWKRDGRLPRTEFTGESDYASILRCLTGISHAKILLSSKYRWANK